MENKYKATIIIPCYNKQKFIKKALNSIIELSRFNDFEVIVIDDGSKDKSVDIIKKYTEKYDNIKLIEFEKGSGSPSKPRNTGIEKSSAKYLIFMDPDDQIINDGYSTLLTKMEEYDSDLLIGTRIGVNEYGQVVFTDFIDKKYTYVNSNDYSVKLDLLNRNPILLKSIYSKEMIINNNIRFNEIITTSEDESFDMKCVAYAKKITKINDIVYQYTTEATGSITTNVSLRIYKELGDVFKELTNTYRLAFSEEIALERIVSLLHVFYLKKLTYLKSVEEIEEGCNYIYQALDKYGFDKFNKLVSRQSINIINDIKNKEFNKYINFYFLKRINRMEKRLDYLNLKSKEYEQIKKRKIIKMGIHFINFTNNIKKKKRKNRANTEVSEKRKEYIDKIEKLYSITSNKNNGYWLFMDRIDNAKDNGEALYRYVKENKIHEKIVFALSEESKDYARLKEEGFNLVKYDSFEHWKIMKNAEYVFTSHCDNLNLHPWYYLERKFQLKYMRKYQINSQYKLVFLQHGVIRSDLSSWLGTKKYFRFITSSPYEKLSLLSIPNYRLTENEVVLTGLARWDYLKSDTKNVITIFPTWRKEIILSKNKEMIGEEFINTEFYKKWNELLNDSIFEKLPDDYTINFVSHHDNVPILKHFENTINKRINIINYNEVENFYDIVNATKVFITDYSSFSFDYLYLNKPVIYYDFEKNALNNNIKDMEYSKYGYYCTDIKQVDKAFEKIQKNDYKLENKYVKNINKLFAYRDDNNCKRIIDSLNINKKENIYENKKMFQ